MLLFRNLNVAMYMLIEDVELPFIKLFYHIQKLTYCTSYELVFYQAISITSNFEFSNRDLHHKMLL